MRRLTGALICLFVFIPALYSAEADSGGLPPSSRPESCPTLTDRSGRKLSVTRPFSRIISLYCAHTENLLFMGAGDRLIGSADCGDLEETTPLPEFSVHDGIEKYLAAAPDLILVRPMVERAHAGLIRKLERMGIAVASLQPDGPEELPGYWRALGMLSGCLENAEKKIEAFEDDARQIAGSIAGREPKTVYFIARHRQMRTFSHTSMALFCLQTAGGINVATDAVPSRGSHIARYSKELLLAKADAIDLILVQTGRMNRVSMEEVVKEPGFSAIPAIQRGDVFFVDEAIVSRPTFRLIRGMETIRGILYPETIAGRIQ